MSSSRVFEPKSGFQREMVQRTLIFVAHCRTQVSEGAAHRNIVFNVPVRCTS